MESLVGTLIAGAVTGLVVLAYREPPVYRRVFNIGFTILFGVWALVAFWKVGSMLYEFGRIDVAVEMRPDSPLSEIADRVGSIAAGIQWLKVTAWSLGGLVALDFLLQRLPKLREQPAGEPESQEDSPADAA